MDRKPDSDPNTQKKVDSFRVHAKPFLPSAVCYVRSRVRVALVRNARESTRRQQSKAHTQHSRWRGPLNSRGDAHTKREGFGVARSLFFLLDDRQKEDKHAKRATLRLLIPTPIQKQYTQKQQQEKNQ